MLIRATIITSDFTTDVFNLLDIVDSEHRSAYTTDMTQFLAVIQGDRQDEESAEREHVALGEGKVHEPPLPHAGQCRDLLTSVSRPSVSHRGICLTFRCLS